MKKFRVIFLTSSILLSGCAKWSNWWNNSTNDVTGPYQGMSAEELFAQAEKSLKQKEYGTAIKRYEALESMYPFHEQAETAQLHLIDAYYKNQGYASAAATAEQYIRLYPRSQQVDYAYYMKGLANFQQLRGVFANYLPFDESWRDAGTQAQAYNDFAILVERFPTSRYRAEALQRMIYLRNMMAQSEFNVAKYYFDRKMYVASAERANYLIKNYPQAPLVKKALVILYRSNQALGLKPAAEEVRKVYQHNYHEDI